MNFLFKEELENATFKFLLQTWKLIERNYFVFSINYQSSQEKLFSFPNKKLQNNSLSKEIYKIKTIQNYEN